MSLKTDHLNSKDIFLKIEDLNNRLRQLTPFERKKSIDFEIAIDTLAKQIIKTPFLNEDERSKALLELMKARTRLIYHVPVNGLTGSVLFCNLALPGTPPTPLCPAYNKMLFPTISSYHTIGSNIASIRLDPKAVEHFPKEIILPEFFENSAIKTDCVDLFLTVIDGRPFNNLEKVNLVTHPWSHANALPGDDTQFDVEMGIFPEIGIEKANDEGAVAMGKISPMNVHCHYTSSPKSMLYSPNNAHFKIIPGTPFAVMWSLMKKEGRIAVTKMIIIMNYDHPICAPIIHSIRSCPNLETHLMRMQDLQKSIPSYFSPLCNSFVHDRNDSMKAFHDLPLAFQHGIYKEAWILKGSPHGIHGDFGRASFENDPSLDAQHHCDSTTKAKAVEQFAHKLIDMLLTSHTNLLLHSQSMVKSNSALKLMQTAQKVLVKEPAEGLSAEELEASYYAIWQLSGCPRLSDFGTKTFQSALTDPQLKASALLLAASRQKPGRIEEPPSIVPFINLKEEESSQKSEKKENPRINKKDEPSLINQVLKSLIELASNGEFHIFSNSEKSAQVNHLIESLPPEFKNKLHGKIYENSNDPNKGGENWGKIHIADDLDTLILSYQELMEN